MSLKVYADVEQGTERWHDLRRGIVTASTVGKLITTRGLIAAEVACPVCNAPVGEPCVTTAKGKAGPIKNVHPDRAAAARDADETVLAVAADSLTFEDLALLLASERITGWTEETFTSDAMWRGIVDEPRALAVYANTRAPVQSVGFIVDDRFGFPIGYSPDGLVGTDGLVEVKSRAPKSQVKTVVRGEVPGPNYAQLQCALLVTGRAWIDYISFAGGMHMYVERVLPDQQWFDVIVAAARQLETRIAELVTSYHANTDGLVMTERIAEEIHA